MENWLEGLVPIVDHQDLKVPYRYSMGAITSKFFIEIRDHKKILGIKCPQCHVVFVPPRSTCGRCFSLLKEWVAVSDRGTLQTYTVVHYPTPVQPAPAPLIYGIIKLDGADTGLAHLISETDYERLSIGMRVQAVFKEERAGNMLDIQYFKPIS
ncbi:MAG: Zn-ribbon domain-containing OB-fold protein [Pseudomonadota bacterium]